MRGAYSGCGIGQTASGLGTRDSVVSIIDHIVRGLLCECACDDMGNIGFVSLRAFK